jgi:hypothetical protein
MAAAATHTDSADRDNRENCGTMILSPWKHRLTMPRHTTQTRQPGLVPHTHRRRIRAGFPPDYDAAFRSALAVRDLHRLQHVRDHMVRLVFLAGPRPSVAPYRAEAGGPSPADVGHQVVTDRPSPIGKTHAAPLRSNLEQADVRLAHASR